MFDDPRELGRLHAERIIESRRIDDSQVATIAAMNELARDAKWQLEQYEDETSEFAVRYREYLRGLLVRCD